MHYFYEKKALGVEARYTNKLKFSAHLHEHLELILLIKGNAYGLIDSQPYQISGGDAFIIFPNQVHEFLDERKIEGIIFIFPPQTCPELMNIFDRQIPVNPIIKRASDSRELEIIMRRMIEVNDSRLAYADIILRGYLTAILGELFTKMDFTDIKRTDTDMVRSVLEYCLANYTQDICLQNVAENLHISRHYVSHLFSGKLHMKFTDYIGMLRVSEAMNRIRTGTHSLTEIAFQVGFNSIRSFDRAFIKHMGITPSAYRNMANQGKAED